MIVCQKNKFTTYIINETNQKGCQMGLKNNQDWRNIYILPFKTMAIMASSIVPFSFI
jgi:hypothetical protein